MAFVVAIDGPAGSGKGTITKLVGKKMGLINIDTGAMYRCVALECLNRNILPEELEKIEKVLEEIDIRFKRDDEKEIVFLNGNDVTGQIRSTIVNSNVAKFAAIKIIRDKMTPIQREMGKQADIIMEGRDIGTVVFPDADVKIFLDCSIEERANRRFKQNQEKGIKCTYEEVLESIKERHKLETEREVAPFVQAEDAIYVDSTKLTIEEVVKKIVEIIEEKRKSINK
ncbi:MAG: (d)CMP kinase [Clostridia bacterium]|nr:(d)CMP kinase [Clostridia bacterium]